jgi:hypothetical protein
MENVGAPTSAAPAALDVGSQVVDNSQVDSGGVEGVEAPQAQAAKAQAEQKKYLNSLKLKVNGQEYDEELPFQIEENPEAVEYLTKQLQLSKAAQAAMQENSSYKKQVNAFLGQLKGNTRQALIDMGIDPKEFAASVIEDEIKKAQMSPEQRRQQELETELNTLKEEAKRKDDEFKSKEMERLQQMEFNKIESQMMNAIEKTDLPKEPYIIRRVAEYMYTAAKHGVEITPDEAMPLVRNELLADLQRIIKVLPDDKAEEFIGKEVLDRFRKKNLAKAKQTPGSVKSSIKDVAKTAKPEAPVQKQLAKDFFGF